MSLSPMIKLLKKPRIGLHSNCGCKGSSRRVNPSAIKLDLTAVWQRGQSGDSCSSIPMRKVPCCGQ